MFQSLTIFRKPTQSSHYVCPGRVGRLAPPRARNSSSSSTPQSSTRYTDELYEVLLTKSSLAGPPVECCHGKCCRFFEFNSSRGRAAELIGT
eukprot:6605620-Pyramimonas_sp.AAC.1